MDWDRDRDGGSSQPQTGDQDHDYCVQCGDDIGLPDPDRPPFCSLECQRIFEADEAADGAYDYDFDQRFDRDEDF